MIKLLAPFNYDADQHSLDTGLSCPETTLTQQQFRDEADINYIMERFGVTGELPQVQAPRYGDYTDVLDYHSAMNTLRAAQEGFMQLPAAVRARFGNDPGQLLEFCSDEGNRAEAEKLGLVFPTTAAPAAGAPAPAGGEHSSTT